ncbi:MAG: ATP-binding cassette domain-containing protein [Methanoregulaceae archaeon]|jgi:ABC-2 type transport system ATP-binding protein|nr:ATP-binding cassette domain-containing protein [Methanoregulaceae archaeon]MCU0628629.1 ATP-binding cassette domain-containing protein [Methanoregulaceae archaeon]
MAEVNQKTADQDTCASAKDSPDIIRIQDLTKIFRNKQEVTAVDHVSFTVRRGEIFGLLGPNGAGKSTLIRILTTLMQPTSGTACVDQYIIGKDDGTIRSIIGVCPQNSTLDIELSAYDNLDFYGNLLNVDETLLQDRIWELLEMVDLTDRAAMPVKTFSGGMRRKLEIVRAFLHHPLLLFLDEPTIGLDPESRREVWQQISRLNTEKTTIILTTHYMDEAEKLCDRIAFMNRGKLIALDTPDNLKKVIPTGELLEIGFGHLDEGVITAIRDLAEVRSVEVQDQILKISVSSGSKVLPVVLANLERFSIPVLSISIRAPSLEDVFIYLTGTGFEAG